MLSFSRSINFFLLRAGILFQPCDSLRLPAYKVFCVCGCLLFTLLLLLYGSFFTCFSIKIACFASGRLPCGCKNRKQWRCTFPSLCGPSRADLYQLVSFPAILTGESFLKDDFITLSVYEKLYNCSYDISLSILFASGHRKLENEMSINQNVDNFVSCLQALSLQPFSTPLPEQLFTLPEHWISGKMLHHWRRAESIQLTKTSTSGMADMARGMFSYSRTLQTKL